MADKYDYGAQFNLSNAYYARVDKLLGILDIAAFNKDKEAAKNIFEQIKDLTQEIRSAKFFNMLIALREDREGNINIGKEKRIHANKQFYEKWEKLEDLEAELTQLMSKYNLLIPKIVRKEVEDDGFDREEG